jgi:hypothetical protein
MTGERMDMPEDGKTRSLRKARVRGRRKKCAVVEENAQLAEENAQFEENPRSEEESQLGMGEQLDEESLSSTMAQKRKSRKERKKKKEEKEWKEAEEPWDDEFPPDEIAEWKEGEEQREEEEWEEKEHEANVRNLSCTVEELTRQVEELTARELALKEALRTPWEAVEKLSRSKEEAQAAPITAVIGALVMGEATTEETAEESASGGTLNAPREDDSGPRIKDTPA